MFAIRNKRTGTWLYGTDYRYMPHKQRTSEDRAQTWETREDAEYEFRHRQCGKDYEVVPVRIEVLE